MLPKAAFEVQLSESDLVWALVASPVSLSPITSVPVAFEPILTKFIDIFPEELPQE